VNANRMWHLIAEMVANYAEEGDLDTAMETLKKALALQPQWVPNAVFDERTRALRGRSDYAEAVALPPDDAPAHYNMAQVAVEYQNVDAACEYLTAAFQLAQADGTVEYLVEAVREDDTFRAILADARVSELLSQHAS